MWLRAFENYAQRLSRASKKSKKDFVTAEKTEKQIWTFVWKIFSEGNDDYWIKKRFENIKKAMVFHWGMNLISTYALISIAFFDALFALSKSNNKRSAKLCALLRLRQWWPELTRSKPRVTPVLVLVRLVTQYGQILLVRTNAYSSQTTDFAWKSRISNLSLGPRLVARRRFCWLEKGQQRHFWVVHIDCHDAPPTCARAPKNRLRQVRK